MDTLIKRYAIKIEYDGTGYAGWQRQNNGITVQESVENALLKLSGDRISVLGASRTDAGVHALGQVAHFDSRLTVPASKLFLALNTLLPPDIRVTASTEAPQRFHSRFDAFGKSYLYRVKTGRHAPAISRNICEFVPGNLDIAAMQKAANIFIGTHDFKCAMATGSSAKTTVRTIYSFEVREKDGFIEMEVSGNAFLYNMVRILAGTLIRAGQNRLSVCAMQKALETGDRELMGYTAPAKGLTLLEVRYEPDIFARRL
ncbi:MAG: tRNA pseudouridine(38-40) synthase TruA [Christensenellales bacterium]|jgi:tRNA pseudouridine38-40 synthase